MSTLLDYDDFMGEVDPSATCIQCGKEPPAFPEGGVGIACARKSIGKLERQMGLRRATPRLDQHSPSSRQRRIEKRRAVLCTKTLPALSVTLKELRIERGISQDELAKRAGIHVKTISSFETGARTPRMKVVQLGFVCCALGITLETFFAEVAKRETR